MATTAVQGLPYPALTDPPNGPTQIQALAQAVETQLVMVFADATTRDQKITAPKAGMIAYITNPGIHTWYNGTAWALLTPQAPVFVSQAGPGTIAAAASNSVQFNITVPPLVSNLTGEAYFDLGTDFSASAGTLANAVVFYQGGTVGTYFWKVFPASASTARDVLVVPYQAAVTAGSRTIICRVLNQNPSGGAVVRYNNIVFKGTFS